MKILFDHIPPSLAYNITRITVFIGLIVVTVILFMVIKKPITGTRKGMPHKIYVRLCILAIINMLVSLLSTVALTYSTYEDSFRFRAFQSEVCYFLYGFSWFFLMDYIIRRNNSRIKRNNIRAAILSVVIIVTRIIMIRLALGEDNTLLSGTRKYINWMSFPIELLAVLLAAAFMMHGAVRIREYQRERKELFSFRLDLFFFPWIIGVVLNIAAAIDIEGLCSAMSLLLAYMALRKRDRYIDLETGLFNENYIEYYDEFARKYKFSGKAALSIATRDDPKDLIPIICHVVTETSFILRRADGRFFIVLTAAERMAVEVMKKNLQDAAHSSNPPIGIVIRHFMKNSYENESEFAQRAFKESVTARE